ncbi:MAG: zinc-ribbon domain-containing protein [Prevotella sp.]|nr:zinc-ribbon domain-containing protein [Prevotella sp.]
MFCKKCGTEQREGHKFCPKCGTPYPIEEDKKEQDEKVVTSVETSKQIEDYNNSMQVIKSKVQSTDDKNEIQTHTPGGRIEEASSISESIIKKTNTLVKIALAVGAFLFLSPFFITGFGFNWFWYLVILGIGVTMLMLFGTFDTDDYEFARKTLVGLGIAGAFMFVWGPLNPSYESGNSNSFSSSDSYNSRGSKSLSTISEDEAKRMVSAYLKRLYPSYQPLEWSGIGYNEHRNYWYMTHYFSRGYCRSELIFWVYPDRVSPLSDLPPNDCE